MVNGKSFVGKKYYDIMNEHLSKNKGKFYELSHHMCHAANAFFSSNFHKSFILTIDGGGNESSGFITASTIYEGNNTTIKKIKKIIYWI